MANSDVVINVKANDLASKVFENISRNAKNASSSVNQFGESASRINSIVNTMTGFAAATVGLNGLADAFHNTAGAALDFYKQMQSGAVATAGTLMSVAQINGKDLGWNQSLEYSTEIMKKLANQAVATGVSTKELSDSFRAALPAAMQGGMTISQLIKLLAPLSSAGKLIGLNDTTLMRDINDIMTGQNVGRTKLGQVLGLSGEEIQQAKANGKLFEYLMQRLQGEAMATTKYLETFEGRVNHLKEAFARVGGTALAPVFDQLKNDIRDVAEKLVVVDQDTQEVYIRPEALETFKQIGNLITTAENQLKLLMKDITSGGGSLIGTGIADGVKLVVENLRMAVKTVAALWVGSKIVSYINDVKAGLTGTAEAHTLIGRAAASAREEIIKEQLAEKQLMETMAQADAEKSISGGTGIGETSSTMAVNETTKALSRKAAAAREAAAAMNEASAIEIEREAAATRQVEVSNEALAVQANSYRNIAIQSEAAGAVQVAGQTAALRSQELTNASVVEGTAATTALNTAAAEAGAAAELANYRAYSGMGTVMAGLKGIGKLVLSLTGGWVGLGMAAAYAVYEMNSAWKDRMDFMKDHAQVVNGETITTDASGNFYRAKTLNSGITDFQRADDLDESTKEQYSKIAKYDQNTKEAYQREALLEKEKEITQYMTKEDNPNVSLPEDLDKAKYRFANSADDKAAKATTAAAGKLAKTMNDNAETIKKANERIAGIIENLNLQLIRQNGSTYESAMAEANKSYNDTLKNIEKSNVVLKSFSGGAGGSTLGEEIVNEAAAHDGEDWKSELVSNARTQCAIFVSTLYEQAGISSLGGIVNGDTLAGKFGGAYHDASSGYTPHAGDLINWSDHVGISDGAGGYWARNSSGGVHHGSMAEANDWFGPALGYGSIDEYTGGAAPQPETVTTTTYAPKEQMDEARKLAKQLLEDKEKEIERQLSIRQRKQDYETGLNTLEGSEGDNRLAEISMKYAEQEAEARDKQKDIYKAIGKNTSDPAEKKRAEAAAEKAVNAEILKDEMKKNQEIRELEDTQHQERMDHITDEAYSNQMLASDSTALKEKELTSYIAEKKKELSTARLTAAEKIKIEKQIVSAEKEMDEQRNSDLSGGLDNLKREIKSYESDIGTTMKDGWNGVANAFTSFGQNMITEHKSVTTRIKDLWKDMANSILNSLMRIAMQKTLENIITAVVGKRSTTSISTVASAADATSRAWDAVGYEYGLADGGMITGPGTSTSDSIPAMLSNGEYVLNASAVKRVGTGFLDSLNTGYIKRFASGGYVSGGSSGTAAAPVQVIVENNTGTPMKATTTKKDDGNRQITQVILSTVTQGIVSNEGHLRELIAGVR